MFSRFMNQVKEFTNDKTGQPQQSLGYGANNKYPEFPPLMSDGRAVTACWQPESTINESIKESNNIKSNWQYRNYMTKNANTIMEYNMKESCNDVGYYKRPIDLNSINSNLVEPMSNPHLYSSLNDETKQLGQTESDLKAYYLSREELNARRIAPSINKEQVLQAEPK